MPVQVQLAAPITRLGQVRSARRRLAAVRAALQSPSPEELGRAIPLLDEAIACLRALEQAGMEQCGMDQSGIAPPGLAPPNADLAQELGALQFELGVVRRLLDGGEEFYRGWSRILALAEGGYMPTGAPTPLMAPGSVSVKG